MRDRTLRNILTGLSAAGVVCILYGVATGPADAQKPNNSVWAPGANYAGVSGSDNRSLCQNMLAEFPFPHLHLIVRGNPFIHIHCGYDLSISPVYMTFTDINGLNWHRTHAGIREVRPGKGRGD